MAKLRRWWISVFAGIGMDTCVIPLRHGGLSLVQTTDYIYPIVDDPYMMVSWLNLMVSYIADLICASHLPIWWQVWPFLLVLIVWLTAFRVFPKYKWRGKGIVSSCNLFHVSQECCSAAFYRWKVGELPPWIQISLCCSVGFGLKSQKGGRRAVCEAADSKLHLGAELHCNWPFLRFWNNQVTC